MGWLEKGQEEGGGEEVVGVWLQSLKLQALLKNATEECLIASVLNCQQNHIKEIYAPLKERPSCVWKQSVCCTCFVLLCWMGIEENCIVSPNCHPIVRLCFSLRCTTPLFRWRLDPDMDWQYQQQKFLSAATQHHLLPKEWQLQISTLQHSV